MKINKINSNVNFKSNPSVKLATQIGEYVLKFRRPFKDEFLTATRKKYLLSLIQQRTLPFIQNNEPIPMAIVGFSLKCPSYLKVISQNADRAEFEALKHLNNFTKGISKIYNQGAILDIYTDGRMFAKSIIGFTDEKVSKYISQLKSFSDKLGTKRIKIHSPEDYYSGSFDEIRTNLTKDFPVNSEKINSDPFIYEYRRFMRDFYAKDIRAQDKTKSIKESKIIGAKVANDVIKIADSYSSFVASLYKKGMLRFSVHGKQIYNSDGKIGLYLNSLNDNCPMPWHGAAVKLPKINNTENFLYEKKNILEKINANFVPNIDECGAYYQFPTEKPYNYLLSLKENLKIANNN